MKAISKSRRNFMVTLGIGGAVAAAAVATKPATVAKESEEKTKSGGYQLTQHVRDYYRSTRI